MCEVVERRTAPKHSNVIADEVIFFPSQAEPSKEYFFRRVEIDGPKQGRLVFLTNHHKLSAITVAAVYKDRWQVELFFKALQQNLRIKTFVGASGNAVRTQVWTALIAMLLPRYLQLRAKFGWSLSNLAALLRQQHKLRVRECCGLFSQRRRPAMKKNSKQQTKQQQTKSQQPAKRQPPAGKPRTPFVEQLETERKQMQQSNEISAVAGVGIGDKRSYVRLVGLDGELLEEIKIPTRPAAIGKYFRSWPRLRVVLESGGQTNWIRRLIAGLGHEVLVADARQLRLISQSYAKNDRHDA